MALLLSQIGAAPPPPPRRWIYSGLHDAPYEPIEELVRVIATGWQHVTPAVPTGRWVYSRTPVGAVSEPDEWIRISTGQVWHVSPAIRFVAPRVVRQYDEEHETLPMRAGVWRKPLPVRFVKAQSVQMVDGDLAEGISRPFTQRVIFDADGVTEISIYIPTFRPRRR